MLDMTAHLTVLPDQGGALGLPQEVTGSKRQAWPRLHNWYSAHIRPARRNSTYWDSIRVRGPFVQNGRFKRPGSKGIEQTRRRSRKRVATRLPAGARPNRSAADDRDRQAHPASANSAPAGTESERTRRDAARRPEHHRGQACEIFAARGEDMTHSPSTGRAPEHPRGQHPPEAEMHERGRWNVQVSPDAFDEWGDTGTRPSHRGVQVAMARNFPFLFGRQALGRNPDHPGRKGHRHRPDELKQQGVGRPRVGSAKVAHVVYRLFEENIVLPGPAAAVRGRGPDGHAGTEGRPPNGRDEPAQRDIYRWNRSRLRRSRRAAASAGGETRPAAGPTVADIMPKRRSTTG